MSYKVAPSRHKLHPDFDSWHFSIFLLLQLLEMNLCLPKGTVALFWRACFRLVRSEEPGCSTKIRIPKMREVGIGLLLLSWTGFARLVSVSLVFSCGFLESVCSSEQRFSFFPKLFLTVSIFMWNFVRKFMCFLATQFTSNNQNQWNGTINRDHTLRKIAFIKVLSSFYSPLEVVLIPLLQKTTK